MFGLEDALTSPDSDVVADAAATLIGVRDEWDNRDLWQKVFESSALELRTRAAYELARLAAQAGASADHYEPFARIALASPDADIANATLEGLGG